MFYFEIWLNCHRPGDSEKEKQTGTMNVSRAEGNIGLYVGDLAVMKLTVGTEFDPNSNQWLIDCIWKRLAFVSQVLKVWLVLEKESNSPEHDSRTGWLWQRCWEDTGPPEHQSSLCNRFCKQTVRERTTFRSLYQAMTQRLNRVLVQCCTEPSTNTTLISE